MKKMTRRPKGSIARGLARLVIVAGVLGGPVVGVGCVSEDQARYTQDPDRRGEGSDVRVRNEVLAPIVGVLALVGWFWFQMWAGSKGAP